jgi:hypothetical protein
MGSLVGAKKFRILHPVMSFIPFSKSIQSVIKINSAWLSPITEILFN